MVPRRAAGASYGYHERWVAGRRRTRPGVRCRLAEAQAEIEADLAKLEGVARWWESGRAL